MIKISLGQPEQVFAQRMNLFAKQRSGKVRRILKHMLRTDKKQSWRGKINLMEDRTTLRYKTNILCVRHN